MKWLWEHGERVNSWWKDLRKKTVRCYHCYLNQHLLFPELKQDHPAKKLKILLFKMCWVKMFSYLKYAPVVRLKLWQLQQLSLSCSTSFNCFRLNIGRICWQHGRAWRKLGTLFSGSLKISLGLISLTSACHAHTYVSLFAEFLGEADFFF